MAGSLLTYETVRRLHAMQIYVYTGLERRLRQSGEPSTIIPAVLSGDLQSPTETGTYFIDFFKGEMIQSTLDTES